MDFLEPGWTAEELETAVAWMAQCYRRAPRGINPTHAQGRLAEQLVIWRLNDLVRVGGLMAAWRKAEIAQGSAARQKAAASNPDWLILDGQDAVAGIVEVKAVRGDAGTLVEDRLAYRLAWVPFSEVVLTPEARWCARMERVWVGRGPRFASQLGNHVERLTELVAGSIIRIDPEFQVVLYVPAGEVYFDIPATIPGRDGRAHDLVIRRLPSIDRLVSMLERAHLLAYDGRPFPRDELQARSRSTADEVRTRLPAMRALLPGLLELFRAPGIDELERRLAQLILGPDPVRRPGESQPLHWQAPEALLERLNSVAPSLTAHVLFDSVGRRNGSCSRQEHDLFFATLARRGSPLSASQAHGLLSSLTRLRLRLRNRDWVLPPLQQVVPQVLLPA